MGSTALETLDSSDDISIEELEALMSNLEDETIESSDEDALEAEAGDVLEVNVAGEELEHEEIDAMNVDESLLSKVAKELTLSDAKKESYDEQESKGDHIDKETAEKKSASSKPKGASDKGEKEKKKREPKPTSFTHARDELVSLKAKPDFHLLEKSDLELDEEGQKAKHEEVLAMIKGMNVKVGAKCVNLLAAANGNARLSTFIEQGVRYILSEPAISNGDLVAYFLSAARNKVKAYGKGTATPQATNLLRLFADMKMIKKGEGAAYNLNEDSLLVESFKATHGSK